MLPVGQRLLSKGISTNCSAHQRRNHLSRMLSKALQLFGTVETSAGIANAMLCVDADRDHEFMIQIWGAGEPAALLLDATEEADGSYHLKPKCLYRSNERGSLYPPQLTPEEIQELYSVSARLQWVGDGLQGDWIGPDQVARTIELKPGPRGVELEPTVCTSWEDYKRWAANSRRDLDAVLFRGHGNNTFKLKTSLHRAGRYRLERYCTETLQQFHAQAEAALNLRLNMNDPADYSVVLGLGQHHGLPTPLLDWTESPYIAAFFAFADALENESFRPSATHVRVFALTRELIEKISPPSVVLPYTHPYVAALAIAPRHNPRLLVQQGWFLVTNVVNLELQIGGMQASQEKPLMHAIDVPIGAAREALEDLAFMGVTAATMFPGLDGICRKLRHQMVFVRSPIRDPGQPVGELPPQTDNNSTGGD